MNAVREIFSPKEFTGWHMLGVMGLFFGTIISVNMFLAFSAGSTWTGLVVKNTYVESQKFNANTTRLEKQASLGWRAATRVEGNTLFVNLTDRKGAPLAGKQLLGEFGRPVHEGDDQSFILREMRPGLYTAEVKANTGLWQLKLRSSEASSEDWSYLTRLTIK